MTSRVQFLKFVDRAVGGFAVALTRVISPRRRTFRSLPATALFIRPGGIGDAVLLVPTIIAFRQKFPAATISVLAEKRNASTFRLCTAVDTILLYDQPKELLSALRGGYDVVVDSEQWHRLSAVIARLTGAPVCVGFATNDRQSLFTQSIPYCQDDYEVDSFFRLLKGLDVANPPEMPGSFLTIPTIAAERSAELLGAYSEQPFVVVFPGASIPERRWDISKFRAVAESLHSLGMPVVVVGGAENREDGERIIAGKYGLNLAGDTSLCETAAVINRGMLLISADSGILHIGVGLGKPTVSLFGPGIASKWAPRGEKHVVLDKNLPCSPCTRFGYTPRCPINAKCMANISAGEVLEAVKTLVNLPVKK